MKNVSYTIQNVVGSAYLHRNVDLSAIKSRYPSKFQYKRGNISALVFRSKKPKMTVLIYASGKMVLLGAEKVVDVKKGVGEVTKYVEKCLGKQKIEPYTEINNIVASGNFNGYIDLEQITRLRIKYPQYQIFYEPEQFPGSQVEDTQKIEVINQKKRKSFVG